MSKTATFRAEHARASPNRPRQNRDPRRKRGRTNELLSLTLRVTRMDAAAHVSSLQQAENSAHLHQPTTGRAAEPAESTLL